MTDDPTPKLVQQWQRLRVQPSLFLVDHFDAIINEIDLECETLIGKYPDRAWQLNEIRLQMIEKIRQRQVKCLASVKREADDFNSSVDLSSLGDVQTVSKEFDELRRRYLMNETMFYIRAHPDPLIERLLSLGNETDELSKPPEASDEMGHLVILDNVFLSDFQILLFR